MKSLAACTISLFACACASQLSFVEQGSGRTYSGTMQGSLLDEGKVSAVIDGVSYEGNWAIENSGSSIDVGEVKYSHNGRLTTTTRTRISFGNTSNYPDTAIGFSRIKESSVSFLGLESHAGTGRMVLTSAAGDQLLCHFDPPESRYGLGGLCIRDDGAAFDLFADD